MTSGRVLAQHATHLPPGGCHTPPPRHVRVQRRNRRCLRAVSPNFYFSFVVPTLLFVALSCQVFLTSCFCFSARSRHFTSVALDVVARLLVELQAESGYDPLIAAFKDLQAKLERL